MKTFKIAKKTNEPVTTVPIAYNSFIVSGENLCIGVEKEKAMDLLVGGKIHFEKFASGNTEQMLKVYEEDAEIKEIVDEEGIRYVYFEYVYIKPLTLASFQNINSVEGYNFKLYFTSDHFMLPCDLSNLVVYVRRGDDIIEFSDLALCYPGEVTKGKNIRPFSGWCGSDRTKLFNYETMERNSILAKNMSFIKGKHFNPEPGDKVLFSTNPFFHTSSDKSVSPDVSLYGCPPGEIVNVCKYVDFMDLDVVLEQDYDAKRMFQEYQVNELFVKKIKNSIIPDFIDLEKVKYAPAFFETIPNEETITITHLATGLTFNLHFRTRISGGTIENVEDYDQDVRDAMLAHSFEDTWHFNDEMSTWNGNGLKDPQVENSGEIEREHLYDDENFVNSSNLIGYLGFTDDDVYNQKNRVKQTFIRLSFYDDKNPLTQNLLCYSTIFLDSGDLYGKYVKRKAWLDEVSFEEEDEEYNVQLNPIVWSPTAITDPCSAVTCQMTVNDEYDMTRSGEGFNLYLFREDAPVENEVQNIYMKVEFNHAGIGRTVPLIFWRKVKDKTGKVFNEASALTISNYLDNLYIPIAISLSDRGYVYSFPDAIAADDNENYGRRNGIVWENERIVLNLFEPMIQPEPEIPLE